jgi:hypothetical protein
LVGAWGRCMDGMDGVDGWHAGAGHDCPAQQAFFGKAGSGTTGLQDYGTTGPRTTGAQDGKDSTGLQDYGTTGLWDCGGWRGDEA